MVLVLNNAKLTDEISKQGDIIAAHSIHSSSISDDEKLLVLHPPIVVEEGEGDEGCDKKEEEEKDLGALTPLWSCIRMVIGNEHEIRKLAENILAADEIAKIQEEADAADYGGDEAKKQEAVLKELLKKVSTNAIFDNSDGRSKRMVVCTRGMTADPMVCHDQDIFTAPLELVSDSNIIDTSGVGDAFAGGLLAQFQLYYEKSVGVHENCVDLKTEEKTSAFFHGVNVDVRKIIIVLNIMSHE